MTTGLGAVHNNSVAINHTFDYIICESKVGCVLGSHNISGGCYALLLHTNDIIAALLIYAAY